jgi:creatine kinase/arginine kinase
MLIKDFLTAELQNKLSGITTKCGFSLDDVIRSGIANPDSDIGIYAGCQDCYDKFIDLFKPVIERYHGIKTLNKQPRNLDFNQLESLSLLDSENQYILSTRIRVGRNIAGYALPAAITYEQRQKVESLILAALHKLDGQYAGQYYPLYDMAEDDRLTLVKKHFLFKKGDRFLEAAGINRDWPQHRGIFHSADKKILFWLNEEDQLRIISMQPGGNIYQVFKRLTGAITHLEKSLHFQFDPMLGYISSCPTNLGTALRASVHIKLPLLTQQENFKSLCDELELSVRGVHGEHSVSEGGVWDLSNKKRLGLSEVDCVLTLYDGIKKLIELEKSLAR